MKQIKQLIEDNVPFAMIQYFESLKFTNDNAMRKYELLTMKGRNISARTLDKKEIRFIKENIPLLIDNKDGKIWEFNNFRKLYYDRTRLQFRLDL